MITRIREVRRGLGLTLDEVAARCDPKTTPQTIGRLETGTRTVSLKWLERIATALGVETTELVEGHPKSETEVAAIVGPGAAIAPRKPSIVVPPRLNDGDIAVIIGAGVGDYRSGDEIWCTRLSPQDYGRALNRDVLVPRPGGRFHFGRLINQDEEKLQLLSLEAGGRQQVVAKPAWLGVATRLIRSL